MMNIIHRTQVSNCMMDQWMSRREIYMVSIRIKLWLISVSTILLIHIEEPMLRIGSHPVILIQIQMESPITKLRRN